MIVLTLLTARSEKVFYTVPSNIAPVTPNEQQTSRKRKILVNIFSGHF